MEVRCPRFDALRRLYDGSRRAGVERSSRGRTRVKKKSEAGLLNERVGPGVGCNRQFTIRPRFAFSVMSGFICWYDVMDLN